MRVNFSKMHGLGNDFIVIDALSQNLNLNPDVIQHLADRRYGIGCDQLLIIEPPTQPDIDFNYRIFNADGGEVEQCGNGARCLGKYVRDKKLTGKKNIKVQTSNSDIVINIVDPNTVQVDMGIPVFEPEKIPFVTDQQQQTYILEHEKGQSEISAVSMGNPHAVLTVENIETADVESLGPVIEAHSRFPERVNVGFMQILSANAIKLRVFERGVGETSACGTGACAAVASGIHRGILSNSVDVALPGGHLQIEWQGNNHHLFMTGDANHIYEGRIYL